MMTVVSDCVVPAMLKEQRVRASSGYCLLLLLHRTSRTDTRGVHVSREDVKLERSDR